MSKKMVRPVININRVYSDKRSVLEAFVTVLVNEQNRCGNCTFEQIKQPEYTMDKKEDENHAGAY